MEEKPETTKASCPFCGTSERKKERSADDKRDLLNRLARIEGQIRGISRMIEQDAYCVDLLTQSAAAVAALGSFERVLLERHVKGCVAEGIRNGDDEKIDELIDILKKLM